MRASEIDGIFREMQLSHVSYMQWKIPGELYIIKITVDSQKAQEWFIEIRGVFDSVSTLYSGKAGIKKIQEILQKRFNNTFNEVYRPETNVISGFWKQMEAYTSIVNQDPLYLIYKTIKI